MRRSLAPEKGIVVEWVRDYFGGGWASETDVAYSNHPITCWVATDNGGCIGFACTDFITRNFFGPDWR